jgi:flagellar protein FlbD
MIHLTRINRVPLVLNSDLIEHIETTPDTVISLTNGQKFVVLETVDEIIGRVVEFKQAANRCDRWRTNSAGEETAGKTGCPTTPGGYRE